MHDNTSAGPDREMDVGSTSYAPTSRSGKATGTDDLTPGYPTTDHTGTTYVSAAGTAYDNGGSGGSSESGGGVKEKAATAAKAGAQAASEGAKDVAQTAKEEARQVAGQVTHQARRVADDVREQVRGQARQQHGTMVSKLRQASDDMRQMSADRDQSPATSLVSNLAERTNRFADHLETRGPEGVLTDVQEFARRRPGAFLLAAAAAGFVVGRLGKAVFTAPNSPLSSGDGDRGDGDYRSAYDAGTTDTYAGFRPTAAPADPGPVTALPDAPVDPLAADPLRAGEPADPLRVEGSRP
jgi:cell division septum initiation protein DivIVA